METTEITRALSVDAESGARPFRTAAVLGAGTMGAQIAAHLANAGLEVHLLDIAPEEGPTNQIVEDGFKRAVRLKPEPFFSDAARQRVRLGNFDDDWARLAGVDWIIEAVVERMDIKRSVMERIEAVASEHAVISTNTSGLPISDIAVERSAAFRSRFLGTHFFNPPRYLKLLELVPTAETDQAVLDRVAHFGRVHLGKGIVVANDRPYFIGNRIGIYGMLSAIRRYTDGSYSMEEIDALTGPLVGRPKSATFRTADVVGLDVMKSVISNLGSAVPGDESVAAFQVPPVLAGLVESGALGAKTRAGFYRKVDGEIRSYDASTGEYASPRPMDLGDLGELKKAGGLPDRFRWLFTDEGRAGAFFRDTSLDMLGYAARRIPEVTSNPGDVDRAIRWGFGWEAGPFEIWDALGFQPVRDAMDEAGIPLPHWIDEMAAAGTDRFYRESAGLTEVYVPGQGYVPDLRPADETSLAVVRARTEALLWQNDEAALLDLGDGVALYEFRSKANALGQQVMSGLVEAIDRVEGDPNLRGLVIGNDGANFSVGANLGEAAMAVAMGQFDLIETFLSGFQQAIQRVRYAEKPVVTAVHQRVLGGACEMTMACPHPVVAAETYMGLVELGVGLIPAGTGTMTLAARAAAGAPNGHDNEIHAGLQKFFEQVAMAKVATSGRMATAFGYLDERAQIVMNADRRFHVAKETVVRLSNAGYLPPPVRQHIRVLGRPGFAALKAGAYQFLQGRFISEYDYRLASDLAYVLTGGDITGPQEVHEDYLLELEREVFLRLLGEEKTRERVTSILSTGKPLRN